ncbi:MAG: SDR family oxidoreductase [Verrucomicrobia bacterium]|nr:SDR family oxidoreductase [Verrucomicrobiota bacterium]
MTAWHSLEKKTIWVTGGAGYLGSPITAALDAAAGKVVCLDLADKAATLVQQQQLTKTIPVSCDLTTADLPALVGQTAAQHGVPDGVVHLVFASSSGQKLEDLARADFQKTIDLSLPMTFELCRCVAECMKPRGGGSVVLFSSMYGVVAPDPRIYRAPMAPNPIDYGASKAAVLAMARYFAVHYGPAGLRFNCVTPGPFPNPTIQKDLPDFIHDLAGKTALRRIGRNTEIVGPTLFLLTDSASFVTGHSLAVDGGWTTW